MTVRLGGHHGTPFAAGGCPTGRGFPYFDRHYDGQTSLLPEPRALTAGNCLVAGRGIGLHLARGLVRRRDGNVDTAERDRHPVLHGRKFQIVVPLARVPRAGQPGPVSPWNLTPGG